MSSLGNHNILLWAVASFGRSVLDLAHNVHALQNLSEDDMSSIKPQKLIYSLIVVNFMDMCETIQLAKV
jgi:hypothetical protein